MIIELKKGSTLFPPISSRLDSLQTTIPLSFDGLLLEHKLNGSSYGYTLDGSSTVDVIELTYKSDTNISLNDLFITNTEVRFLSSITGENSRSVTATLNRQKNGLSKLQKVNLSIGNQVVPSFYRTAVKGFQGSIESSEILTWNVLHRLMDDSKTNKIWNSPTLVTSNPALLAPSRNPDCWIGDLDISGIAVGANIFTQWSQANAHCLITNQVGVGVGHWSGNFAGAPVDKNMTPGTKVAYKDSLGNLYIRTIIASANGLPFISNPFSEMDLAWSYQDSGTGLDNLASCDMVIYLLDEPLPATVKPVQLLGAWAYEQAFPSEDKSEMEQLVKISPLVGKSFFGGLGIYINQFRRAIPIYFKSDKNMIDRSIYSGITDWKGIATHPPVDYILTNNMQFLSNPDYSNLETRPTAAAQDAYYRDYYDNNPQIKPLKSNPLHFFSDDIFQRYYTGLVSGDSGTCSFVVGDNGRLGLIQLVSGGAKWLDYRFIPFITQMINALAAWAGYTGPLAYPEVMPKPVDASHVSRSNY